MKTSLKLTGILINENENGFTGYFKQFPEALAEGETIAEVKANMIKALAVILEYRNVEGNNENKHQAEEVDFNFEVA